MVISLDSFGDMLSRQMGILDTPSPPPWDSGVRAEKGMHSPPTTPRVLGSSHVMLSPYTLCVLEGWGFISSGASLQILVLCQGPATHSE